MAKKDHKEIDILRSVSELNDYIKEVTRKINDLIMRVNSAKRNDKVKALKVRIGALKNTQEDVRERFNDFVMKNFQLDNQGNPKIINNFEDANEGIEGFKKEEDNVNERLNELMMIQFDKSDDLDKDPVVRTLIKGKEQYVDDATCGKESLGAKLSDKFVLVDDYLDNQGNLEFDKSFEDVKEGIEEFKKEEANVEERLNDLMSIQSDTSDDNVVWTLIKGKEQCGKKKCCEFLGAKGSGIQGIKIQEDYVKNEEAPGYNISGQSSFDLEKIPGFGSSDDLGVWTNIEGLELKMHKLVLEGKELLKKDKNGPKKSLIQWIKESSEEREALKAVKDRAVELGTDLSFLLVDLVFIMSVREELLEMFEKFKSLLGTVFKDENFMVMNKIIALLEMTDGEMKELSKMTKESMEGSSKTTEDTELDMSKLREGLVEESRIDELLIQILKAFLRLEYILMHPRLPHSKKSKKVDVKACLKQYKEDLKGVEMKMNELKESSSFVFGSEDIQRLEFLNAVVQGMVIEFWNQLGVSFEEKEPRRD